MANGAPFHFHGRDGRGDVCLSICQPLLCAHLYLLYQTETVPVIITAASKYFSFLYCVYAFCMALVVVDLVQDSVCDLFVLKRNCESLVMRCWFSIPAKKFGLDYFLENVFRYRTSLWPCLYDVLWVVINQYIGQAHWLADIWAFWDHQHWPVEFLPGQLTVSV